jgi:uncharacterized protein (DUF2062 family)
LIVSPESLLAANDPDSFRLLRAAFKVTFAPTIPLLKASKLMCWCYVLVPESIREWFRRNVLRPLLRVLRGGVTPRRLAWSLALGMVVGINPSVGLTTLFVVLVAWAFGLSKLASLIGTHVVVPLHLLLFIPFIEIGVHLFHTRRLPMDRKQLEHLSHHPLRLFHEIWQWEWHALIVWGVVAGIAMPLLAVYLRRALVMLMRRNRTLLRSRPTVH